MVITRAATERLHDFAFRLAQRRRRRGRPGRVTCVDKANVFRSMAFFRRIFDERAARFPDVAADHHYVDATALDLVRKPWDVRRAGHREHVRRHPVRPGRGAGRRHGHGAVGRHRRPARPVPALPRLRARHRGAGHGQPDGDDPVGGDDARLAGRSRAASRRWARRQCASSAPSTRRSPVARSRRSSSAGATGRGRSPTPWRRICRNGDGQAARAGCRSGLLQPVPVSRLAQHPRGRVRRHRQPRHDEGAGAGRAFRHRPVLRRSRRRAGGDPARSRRPDDAAVDARRRHRQDHRARRPGHLPEALRPELRGSGCPHRSRRAGRRAAGDPREHPLGPGVARGQAADRSGDAGAAARDLVPAAARRRAGTARLSRPPARIPGDVPLPGERDGHPLDRCLPLSVRRHRRRLRAAAPPQSGDRRRGRGDHRVRVRQRRHRRLRRQPPQRSRGDQPPPHDGRGLDRRLERRAAPGRRRHGCGGSRTSSPRKSTSTTAAPRTPSAAAPANGCSVTSLPTSPTARPSRTPRASTSPPSGFRRRSTARRTRDGASRSQRSTHCGRRRNRPPQPLFDHSNGGNTMQRRTLFKQLAIVAAVAGALGLAAGAQAQTVLKFSHTDQPGGARHKAAEMFGQKIEQYTQGRYKVQVFPAGQLANDPEGDRAAAAGRHRLHRVVDRLVRDAPRRAQPDDAAVPGRELRAGLEALRRVEVAAGASSPRRRPRAFASSPPGKRASAT